MNLKLFGSILLIVGTTVGAGMLALPIATSQFGFFGAQILLIFCWLIMTAGAYLILEVNLWVQQNSNIITMAKATIGPLGQIIAWVAYLLLLYSLLCAYIAGGSDLFTHLLAYKNIIAPFWLTSSLFTFVAGAVVYLGIRSVDHTNRLLMLLKFSAFLALIFLLIPFVSVDKLLPSAPTSRLISTAIMVTVTSFGFAAIIPSLRVYFANDIVALKKAILFGSLVPLFCYIVWDLAIMGVITHDALTQIFNSENSTSALVAKLGVLTQANTVTIFAKFFTSICVLTSFLGVALCLFDFLADGFQLEKKGIQKFVVYLLTFVPPLFVVLLYPNAFIVALEYAGIYCVILLMLLPAWMAWRGRYIKKFRGVFQVPGGKYLLAFLITLSFCMISLFFFEQWF